MKKLALLAVVLALVGCGAETASTAATAASLEKKEMEQGTKTMPQSQEKIDSAVQQMNQRAGSAAGAEK